MAPHALTPTAEREELFDGSHLVPQHDDFLSNSTSSFPARNTNIAHDQTASSQNAVHNGHMGSTSNGSLAANGSSMNNACGNPPTKSYEDAYTHGYTDGYTSGYKTSTIELKHQPIAIIGMSCRLPGSVSTPDEFWELLARSRTGFSPIPASRFSADRFFHPNPGKSGTTNARGGNFLTQDLTAFDAPFFGFTQQEAISLDPQQRLLLECTFEALETAGIPKQDIVGKDVGVFIGGTFSEYETDLFRDPETMPMHQATGCAMAMQSNRISHFFDLRGPSFTVDTACSSSLVALHAACSSLRNGESSVAIAGGIHLNMLPEFWISYSMSRLFGEAGRSFAFDQRGTGYGRGEGCGLVLLKPLDQAIKDNDPVRAVIVGTGINQDGKTPGITMPNGSAQEALIRSVYKNGGMDPCDTGYIEAHGTGTRVGDPIEVGALQKVFGEGRSRRKPLYIGSVKSNIGHLEAAAGIAGVIKTAMMLERNFILPNYDFKQPNEQIPFDQWGLKVPIRQQPWPLGKRWASVNGFGFGGTNGHVVMTRGPLERKVMREEIETRLSERLFVLSANDRTSTENAMQKLGVYLEQRPEVFQNSLLSNLAYTLGQRRSFHPWRIAVTASSSVDLVEKLSSGKILPCKQEPETLRIGWVFTGQGAQWWAMGRELYHQYPVYASVLNRADTHLRSLGADFSLVAELEKGESTTQVNAACISQPSCTAVQLALVDLLCSWGIRPSAVIGHSSGEIGAAYAAQLITFADAMTIAYHRGRLIPILKKKYPSLDGCMMAVGAGEAQIVPLLDQIPISLGQARIACVNSPSSVTISGDSGAVSELQALLEVIYPGIFVRKLQVDTAYHSHHMNLVAKDYTESLRNIEPPNMSRGVKFYSSLFGRLIAGSELDVTYWVQNLICTVRFDDALQSMCLPVDNSDFKTGVNFLIELGPHAALQGPIKQILKHKGGPISKIAYASVLSRKRDAVQTALAVAGTLFIKGAVLDIGALNFPKPLERPPQVLVDMPRYSWNHSSKFHHESRFTHIHKFHDAPRNDIIGVLAPFSSHLERTWRNVLRLDDLPWLRHHQIQGVTIFPISGFLVMAIEAAAQVSQDIPYKNIEASNVIVKKTAVLTDEEVEMTITMRPNPNSADPDLSHEFVIRSWSRSKGWTEHCTGEITIILENLNDVDGERVKKCRQSLLKAKSSAVTQAATQSILSSQLYEQLSKINVIYGTTFQGLRSCCASPGSSRALLVLPDTVADMPHYAETNYILHPALLEQLVSMYWPILSTMGPLHTIYLPTSIGKFTVSLGATDDLNAPEYSLQATCMASGPLSDRRPNKLSMFVQNPAGEAVVAMEDLIISPILERSIDSDNNCAPELCYKLTWETLLSLHELETRAAKRPIFDTEVVIIHGETEIQTKMASVLIDQLTEVAGIQPVAGSLLSIAAQSDDKLCILLTEIDHPMLASLDEVQFDALQQLLTKVRGLLWIVHGAYVHANNPTTNMVSGLSRTLRSEGTLMRFITLELDGQRIIEISDIVSTIMAVFNMTLCAHSEVEETEFMERDGQLFTPRIVDDHDLNAYVDKQINPPSTKPADFSDIRRPLRGLLVVPGIVDSLVFEDDLSLQHPVPEDHVEFHVRAIGVNTNDIYERSVVGLECSGIVTAIGSDVPNVRIGDQIAAITTQGSLSTVARTHFRYVFKLPNHTPFEVAASMPIAYCTAAYALIEQARLSENDSALIHDAANAVGQAAMAIAQMIGAQIWATVRTKGEKDALMRDFGITEDRIWFAAADTFAEHILNSTRGHGIDVIFNTLTTTRLLRATSKCLANFGRLINVQASCNVIDNACLDKNASVLFTDIDKLIKHRPQVLQRTLASVAQMLQYGKIPPIRQIKTFRIPEAVSALNSVQTAGVHGKAVIIPQCGDLVVAPSVKEDSSLLRHDATYILIGGTGGLGRSIATWMVKNGAKNIVLLSRSGVLKGKAKGQIDALNEVGANVVIRRCDVADRADVEELVYAGLLDMPPVRGIIHGAMVLHDVLFEKMKHEQYTAVIASKVQGAWNFYHTLSASQLDFFIVISSAAGAVGNRGQAAYAAANTFLNGFAQYLRRQGIKSAASIDLTAVSDAGYLAEDAEKAAEVAKNLGSDTICEAQVLALIRAAIDGKLASCNQHPITGMRITPTMQPFWTRDAKFVHLRHAAEAASSTPITTTITWSAAYKAALSPPEAEQIVCSALVEKIAQVVSMEPEELDVSRPISCYPLDSLTAIEVRNFITRMFEANLQVLELLASGSINNLAKIICVKSKIGITRS